MHFTPDEKAEIGKRLALRRRKEGKTQKECAAELGISDRQYQRMENGVSISWPNKMQEYADRLGVDISDLSEGREGVIVQLRATSERLDLIETRIAAPERLSRADRAR